MATYPDFVDDGKTHEFSGVDYNCFKLDGVVYEAVEDPSDGYRSYLDTIKAAGSEHFVFPPYPFADVLVMSSHGECEWDFEGFVLIDARDGHVWLKVGTSNTMDYYPYFTFEYHPKAA
jgi:hypothetical protein